MSDLDPEIQALCAFNRKLARDSSLLRLRVRSQEAEIAELKAVLAKVDAERGVEREAAEILMGAAIDGPLEAQ